MVSQTKGLAAAIGLPFDLRSIPLKWPWCRLWPGLIPVSRSVLARPDLVDLAEGGPRLLITCGRQGIVTSLYLKRKLGGNVLTVHIQDPKIAAERFDLVVVPEHDGLRGSNVLTTRGAVHHINDEVLAEARRIGLCGGLEKLARPFVLVLLGGANRHYHFGPPQAEALIDKLRSAVAGESRQLAILPSRRTDPQIVQQFHAAFGEEHFVWRRDGENPYLSALAHATHVICTADSVSMISEAAATGRPLLVEYFPERRAAHRLRTFHGSFAEMGITRPFEGRLADWTYTPPNDTARIAQLILQRLGEAHVAQTRSAA